MCFESGVWGGSLPAPDLSDGSAVRGSMCLALDKHAARGPPPPATPGLLSPLCLPCFHILSLPRVRQRQRDGQRDSETMRDAERQRDDVLSFSVSSYLSRSGPGTYFWGPVKNGNVGGASCSKIKHFKVARHDCTGGTLWSLSASPEREREVCAGSRVGKAHANPIRCSSCPPLYWRGWQNFFKKGEKGGKLASLTGLTPKGLGAGAPSF